MKRDKQDYIFAAIGACVFIAVFFFVPSKFFLAFNDFPNQYFYGAFNIKSPQPLKIVAVAIDDYSLNKISAQWPWKRSVYAQAIKILDNEGVKTIGFDLVLKGVSEDSPDEQVLVDTLKNTRAAVVMGYDFDFKDLSPGLPSPAIMAAKPAVGMLNTLLDDDGLIRKMRVKYNVDSQEYYSFSVMMAGSLLGKTPSEVVSDLPTAVDLRFREYRNIQSTYFYINYKVKQYDRNGSVLFISFYDVLNNMEGLKKELGNDFLKNCLVLVYPTTEISHDVHLTPIGRVPGGLTHLNAIINILSHSGVDSPGYIPVIMFLLSVSVLMFALRSDNFQTGLVVFTVVLVFNFLGALLLWHFHLKTDSFRIIMFSIIFFVLTGAYKSIAFMTRLAVIKDRAMLDPLRGMYTLRYFRYRLELEVRRHRVHVIMVHLEDFKENTDELLIERLKEIWSKMNFALSKVHRCWASYSADEVVCFSSETPARLEGILQELRDGLDETFKQLDMKIEVKICAVEFKKDWASADVFYNLASKARSLTARALIVSDLRMDEAGKAAVQASSDRDQILDGLADDIDEKNRQLLIMYEKLKEEDGKTKEAFYQIITSLVNALEARDPYTQGHSQRVSNYALLLAERLGWPKDQKERLRKAALLHDLGKIGIPDSILHKKGQLTEEEFGFIKQHEIFAVNILKPLKEIDDILPWILYHHEKWDGTGYPHGLGGDAIPLGSQLIALADVYDALTTGRDYKKAISRPDAIAIILKGKGSHFNPDLADKFVEVINQAALL